MLNKAKELGCVAVTEVLLQKSEDKYRYSAVGVQYTGKPKNKETKQ